MLMLKIKLLNATKCTAQKCLAKGAPQQALCMLTSEYTILPLSLAFKVLTVEFQSESIPSALKYKEYPYEHKKKITDLYIQQCKQCFGGEFSLNYVTLHERYYFKRTEQVDTRSYKIRRYIHRNITTSIFIVRYKVRSSLKRFRLSILWLRGKVQSELNSELKNQQQLELHSEVVTL